MTSGAFERIIAAIDGSENSLAACKAAAILANRFKSEMTLLEVIPAERVRFALRAKELRPRLELEAKKHLEIAASVAKKEGVDVKTETLHADPSVVKAIDDYAAEKRSDLIVLGARGEGGFREMLLGGVSSSVATHAQCSVLVVRSDVKADASVLSRILVGVDGSRNSQDAARTAAKLAKGTGAELAVIYVIHMPTFMYDDITTGSPIDTLEDDERDYGKKILAEAASMVKEEGVDAKQVLLEEIQSPGIRITKYAETNGFDLIVIGARGVHGFERLLLGSVASGVMHFSHCSVLLAR